MLSEGKLLARHDLVAAIRSVVKFRVPRQGPIEIALRLLPNKQCFAGRPCQLVKCSNKGRTPMSTSRRRILVAGSSAFAVAASSRVRAQSPEAARKAKIDSLLQRAVEAGDVPGVIAIWRNP
jgi:hypothetical protein